MDYTQETKLAKTKATKEHGSGYCTTFLNSFHLIKENSCLIVVNKNVNAKRNQCCFKINEVTMLTLDPTTQLNKSVFQPLSFS